MDKVFRILVLKDGDIHPTVERAVCLENYGTKLVTASGLKFDLDAILKVGSTIDEGKYKITSIGTNAIEVFGCDGSLRTVPLEKIEWCDSCEDFHVYLDDDDEIDEYTSGYTDAFRDFVEYMVKDYGESSIGKILDKMGYCYISDLDTDAKIAEFVSKRFEKKPQLTLDELKEIVGYDFNLV